MRQVLLQAEGQSQSGVSGSQPSGAERWPVLGSATVLVSRPMVEAGSVEKGTAGVVNIMLVCSKPQL